MNISEQKIELAALYKAGKVPEAMYISLLASLNAQLGTDLRIAGISMNVPPLQATLKDKKDRQGNVVAKDVKTVKGGLVTVTGSINGERINNLYMNAEVVKWIIDNSEKVTEYLGQDHMTYRRAGQTSIDAGAMTAKELYA